jgi:hypothetical protein
VLEPGITAIIGPNLRHSGRALTDCLVRVSFHPHRTYYPGRLPRLALVNARALTGKAVFAFFDFSGKQILLSLP